VNGVNKGKKEKVRPLFFIIIWLYIWYVPQKKPAKFLPESDEEEEVEAAPGPTRSKGSAFQPFLMDDDDSDEDSPSEVRTALFTFCVSVL
jgi:hypothetical protein